MHFSENSKKVFVNWQKMLIHKIQMCLFIVVKRQNYLQRNFL